jgi:head-tail adaptor
MSGIVANLMRPTKATGSLGETQGKPEVVCKNVPFRTFKTLSGNEQEQARKIGVTATHSVEVWGNPAWKDLEECWFETIGSNSHRLNIAFVEDRKLNGLDLRILCGENK